MKIVRYTYDGAELAEPFTIIDNIKGAWNHDGCRIVFDDEGKMYITTGDAANKQLPLDMGSVNGKVLRLNQDGSVPDDNPYIFQDTANSYIWSFGHRNPQGLVFHNGILYSSEHGPSTNDELNIIKKESNYGWPEVEGFCNESGEKQYCEENNVVEPISIYYENSTLAVAGIDFYDVDGSEQYAISKWDNSILMTSLKSGDLVLIELDETGTEVVNEEFIIDGEYGRLRSVCVAPDGRVYFGTSNKDNRGNPTFLDDQIYVITPKTSNVETKDKGSLLEVFPNPSLGNVTISSNLNNKANVVLLDMNGREVNSFDLPVGKEYMLDTSKYSSGQYTLQIVGESLKNNKILTIIN